MVVCVEEGWGKDEVREAAKLWFRWKRVRPELGLGCGYGEGGIAGYIFKMSDYQL